MLERVSGRERQEEGLILDVMHPCREFREENPVKPYPLSGSP